MYGVCRVTLRSNWLLNAKLNAVQPFFPARFPAAAQAAQSFGPFLSCFLYLSRKDLLPAGLRLGSAETPKLPLTTASYVPYRNKKKSFSFASPGLLRLSEAQGPPRTKQEPP
jgi:hypothetical protein